MYAPPSWSAVASSRHTGLSAVSSSHCLRKFATPRVRSSWLRTFLSRIESRNCLSRFSIAAEQLLLEAQPRRIARGFVDGRKLALLRVQRERASATASSRKTASARIDGPLNCSRICEEPCMLDDSRCGARARGAARPMLYWPSFAPRLSRQAKIRTPRGASHGTNRSQIGDHRHGLAGEVEPGDKVEAGDTLVMIESMKMEIPVITEDPGTVKEILVKEKDPVAEGQVVAMLEE